MTYNLLITDHLINKELNTGNAVDVVFFDVSKAFDTVSHSTLPLKLSNSFGVVGKLRTWLKSFLTGHALSKSIIKFILISLVSHLLSLMG